jgi:hypothetical protein
MWVEARVREFCVRPDAASAAAVSYLRYQRMTRAFAMDGLGGLVRSVASLYPHAVSPADSADAELLMASPLACSTAAVALHAFVARYWAEQDPALRVVLGKVLEYRDAYYLVGAYAARGIAPVLEYMGLPPGGSVDAMEAMGRVEAASAPYKGASVALDTAVGIVRTEMARADAWIDSLWAA